MSDIHVVFFIILVIWLGIGGYVAFLHSKIGKLEKELEKLKRDYPAS